MTIMLVLSFLLAVALPATAIWKDREIPVSISSLVYLFDGNRKWLWTVWLWLVTFLLAPSLIESMPEDFKFIGFFMLAGLVVTGALPIFDKEKKDIHDTFGFVAGVLSQACVAAVCPWWLFSWLLFPLVFWLYYRMGRSASFMQRMMFFAECLCAFALYGALFTA